MLCFRNYCISQMLFRMRINRRCKWSSRTVICVWMRDFWFFAFQKSSTASERPCGVFWFAVKLHCQRTYGKIFRDVWLSSAVSLPRPPSRFHVCPPSPSPHTHTPTTTTIFSLLLRLFHIIVDTDRTASQILSVMNKQKMAGEVTFLPLNKLQPSTPEYPNSKVRRSVLCTHQSVSHFTYMLILISDASMEHVPCP